MRPTPTSPSALTNLVQNWMANGVTCRGGLHSQMTTTDALMRSAGNMSAPGAVKCFREVADKLGPSNTLEALVLRAPYRALFPPHVLAGAAKRINGGAAPASARSR